MDQKELKSLLKLLRAQGVQQYITPELSLVLGEQPEPSMSQASIEKAYAQVEDERLTPEEEAERLLFYSATPPPVPEDN